MSLVGFINLAYMSWWFVRVEKGKTVPLQTTSILVNTLLSHSIIFALSIASLVLAMIRTRTVVRDAHSPPTPWLATSSEVLYEERQDKHPIQSENTHIALPCCHKLVSIDV